MYYLLGGVELEYKRSPKHNHTSSSNTPKISTFTRYSTTGRVRSTTSCWHDDSASYNFFVTPPLPRAPPRVSNDVLSIVKQPRQETNGYPPPPPLPPSEPGPARTRRSSSQLLRGSEVNDHVTTVCKTMRTSPHDHDFLFFIFAINIPCICISLLRRLFFFFFSTVALLPYSRTSIGKPHIYRLE